MSLPLLFHDPEIVRLVQARLPALFQLAELESSRAGKIGMEVGSVREKILIALLIYKFGAENVRTDLPIHETEMDVIVNREPVSIKTMTGKKLGGVKLIWTVDHDQAIKFAAEFLPTCDMLLVHINWDGIGGLYFFPRELQSVTLHAMARNEYFTLPKQGTNPRGVEVSTKAVREMASHPKSMYIPVKWVKQEILFDPYKRWLELWEQD